MSETPAVTEADDDAVALSIRVAEYSGGSVLRTLAVGLEPLILLEPTPEEELGESIEDDTMYLSVHVSALDAAGAALLLRSAADACQELADGTASKD